MPFGSYNTLTTFIRFINEVLHPYIEYFIIVYLDYILIYNNTQEEHLVYIRKFLELLREHKL